MSLTVLTVCDTCHLLLPPSSGVTAYLGTEVITSREKQFGLVTFVDTPGLVDGDMKYPFDVEQTLIWLGQCGTGLVGVALGECGSGWVWHSCCPCLQEDWLTLPWSSSTLWARRSAREHWILSVGEACLGGCGHLEWAEGCVTGQ